MTKERINRGLIMKAFLKLVLMVVFLSACQTADFGLNTKETKPEVSRPTEMEKPYDDEESLDQKKVNKNKLFNTSEDRSNIRPKVGLILGPGLSYSLIHLGVLKSLNDQKIPVEVIAGMGWSSLIAANYALNGAVNDMRWKAFQGSFGNVVNTAFLRGSIKETSGGVYDSLIDQYTRGRSINQSKINFICPSLQVTKGQSFYFKSGKYSQALKSCMKVPPLAQSDATYWAYITDVKSLASQMRSMGAQKIIFVNVVPSSGMNWGDKSSSIDGRDKYFWGQVLHGVDSKQVGVDHVLSLGVPSHEALDFKNVRKMIENSEMTSKDYFAKFARTYSF